MASYPTIQYSYNVDIACYLAIQSGYNIDIASYLAIRSNPPKRSSKCKAEITNPFLKFEVRGPWDWFRRS